MIRFISLFALLWLFMTGCESGTAGESCSDGILGDTEYTIDCGGDCPLCTEFFEGGWISEGENLSNVWKELFMARKIGLFLDPDQSYSMRITDQEGETMTNNGTYTLADSGVKKIWTIKLNQTQPDSKTFEGIIKAQDNYVLKIEIVQTEPYINAIPPTPEEGLGSTKTETSGNVVPFPGNIQTYIRD